MDFSVRAESKTDVDDSELKAPELLIGQFFDKFHLHIRVAPVKNL